MQIERGDERFNPEILHLLKKAGWHEARDVFDLLALPAKYEIFPEAKRVLAEFGGLHIEAGRADAGHSTSDMEIRPRAGEGLEEIVPVYEDHYKVRLYPIGEFHGGHVTLLIDDQGRIYQYTDAIYPLARSVERAMEILLLGEEDDPAEVDDHWDLPNEEVPDTSL